MVLALCLHLPSHQASISEDMIYLVVCHCLVSWSDYGRGGERRKELGGEGRAGKWRGSDHSKLRKGQFFFPFTAWFVCQTTWLHSSIQFFEYIQYSDTDSQTNTKERIMIRVCISKQKLSQMSLWFYCCWDRMPDTHKEERFILTHHFSP